MEAHADKDHNEESFPRDAYLESQEEMTCHVAPIVPSTDTIETSTSPEAPASHQIQYKKPGTLNFSRGVSSSSKALKNQPDNADANDTAESDGAELPDIGDVTTRVLASKESKQKALAQQRRKADKPKMMNPGSDSDSDLEIVPADDLQQQAPQSRADSRSKSAGASRARSASKPLQFQAMSRPARDGQPGKKATASSSAHAHDGKKTLNDLLLTKSRVQGRVNADKRRAEWHSRGGRERKEQHSEATAKEDGQQSNVKSLLQDLQEEAKTGPAEDDGGDEDLDEEDDEDYQPDQQADQAQDEEPAEDDEETAELRAAGLLPEQGSQEEEEEDQEADNEDEDEEDKDEVSGTDTEKEQEAEAEKAAPETADKPSGAQQQPPRPLNSEPSFASESTTLSPTQKVTQPAPAVVAHNFGDAASALGEGGFSQFFEDEGFKTQAPADADAQAKGGLFEQAAQPVNLQNVHNFPNFFVSQREKERNFDQLEAAAGFVAAVQDGNEEDSGPKMQFLNSQGMLTQHAPVDSTSQPSQTLAARSDEADERPPGSDDSEPESSEEEDGDGTRSSSSSPKKLRPLKTVAPSPSQQGSTTAEPEPSAQSAPEELEDPEPAANSEESPQAANAFQMMQQAQAGTSAYPDMLKDKKRKRNAFVQDQADESDEDEGFMRGLRRNNNDDDDEDKTDEEGSVKDLVDDQKVDADVQAEQDERVHEKDKCVFCYALYPPRRRRGLTHTFESI